MAIRSTALPTCDRENQIVTLDVEDGQGVCLDVLDFERAAQGAGEPQQDFKNKNKTRLRWARLLDKIWKTDPLLCHHCGARMRIAAFITSPDNIARILDHVKFKHADQPPPKYRAPPKLCPNPLG